MQLLDLMLDNIVGSKMSINLEHPIPVMSLAGCRQLHLSLFSSRVRLVVSGVEHSSYSVLIAIHF